MTSPAPGRYAVAGHPVAHSRSPMIHAAFARETGEPIVYEAMDVLPERFAEQVAAFRAAGGLGLNATVPLKEIAFRYADRLSERAMRAGAVNTLRFDADGSVFGDNTDGPGLVRDLTVNHGLRLRARRVLMLGAGGAARGVLGPLLDEAPGALLIANRTPQRAVELAARFADQGTVQACALDAIPHQAFDLVVNASASSLSGDTLPLCAAHLAPGALCYDMMYGARPTAFLEQAVGLGAAFAIDGRGMLVEQAAEAFLVWRGVRPHTGAVITALGQALTEA